MNTHSDTTAAPKGARGQIDTLPVLRAQDTINHAKSLVTALMMACSDLQPAEGGPLADIALIVKEKLMEAVEGLEAFRDANGAGPTV